MTNQKELEELFRRHYRQMYRLASLLLHDDAESKDIVHDVFAQLMDSPDGKLLGDKAASFLLTCTRNRCLNVIRSRKIQERVQRLYLLDVDNEMKRASQETEWGDYMQKEMELKALGEGVSLLSPPVCREIIEWHFRDGLTFREIALRLGVSETTVYKHLRSALSQLRTNVRKGLAR